jgi:hypothetical protein
MSDLLEHIDDERKRAKEGADYDQRPPGVGSIAWMNERLRHGQQAEQCENPGYVKVTGVCYMLRTEYTAEYPAEGLTLWLEGSVFVQIALPNVSAGDREFLLSSASPEGWDELYGEEGAF